MESSRFTKSTYLIRRKVLKLVGAAFHIYDDQGNLAFYVDQKGFKLKEAIKVYANEKKTDELLSINARNIVDISATYDVIDSNTKEKIGSFKRKGMKSIVRDEWIILDANQNEIGNIKEDSAGMAMLRRLLTNLVPQKFYGSINNQPVLAFKQKFNLFAFKIDLDFSVDSNKLLDRRMGIAAAVLLCAIEGRQN